MSYCTIFGDCFENEHDEEMTRKYGDKYRYVKSLYPNAYKLPKAEIEEMIDIARWQGETLEEGKELLGKYIKQNEPSWKENYFEPEVKTEVQLKPKASLNFDGQTLSWMEDGKAVKSWPAMSGDPNYQCRTYQHEKGLGPLPEGRYKVPINRLQHWDDLSMPYKILNYGMGYFPKNMQRGTWINGPESWGEHRAWIEPDINDPFTKKNIGDRNNLAIHGGSTFGSNGCVDLAGNMNDFNKMFTDYNQDLELNVSYPQECWSPK